MSLAGHQSGTVQMSWQVEEGKPSEDDLPDEEKARQLVRVTRGGRITVS